MCCGVCEKCITEDYSTENTKRVAYHCDAEGEHKGWIVGFKNAPSVERPAWCPDKEKTVKGGGE